jgi:hypothetical protein
MDFIFEMVVVVCFGVFLYYRVECPASNGQAPLNDVHIINLSLVSDVQVKREVNTMPEAPQSLDLCRVSINNRYRLVGCDFV